VARTGRRFLLINYELPPIGAGAGNATANIARCLAAAGVEVLVLTSAFGTLPRWERRDGYAILRAPAVRRRTDRSSPLEMLSFVVGGVAPLLAVGRRWRPVAACAFFGVPSGPLALLLRAAFGVPYLVSLRGGDVPGFLGREMAFLHRLALPVIRAVWRRSGGLIANSPGLAELARRSWPDAPIELIPNGIDVELFRPPERVRPAEPLRLLCVGRLARQKGVGDLLAALAASPASAVLRVVGDGPERADLEQTAASLGLADRVEFAGWVVRRELPTHYDWGDVFVLPSVDEGMPNVVLEALAAGLPVIGTDVPGTRDLVEPGRSGFLVPPGSPAAIASAIDRLVSSPDLVRLLGAHGRAAALGRRWEGVADRYRRALGSAAFDLVDRSADVVLGHPAPVVGLGGHRRCPARLSTG
jgi:glycosyltransferase involved in cell wall biosynthesis